MNLKKIAYQVVISTRNNGGTILKTLRSIDKAMNDFNKEVKWILCIGDSDSKDKTLIEIGKYAQESTADKIHLFDYDYHEKRGVNENKLIKEIHKFGEDYPLILFMEPAGKMTKERPMMVFSALTYEKPWIVGQWKNIGAQSGYTSDEATNTDFYGPWATLFHISALPEDGKLFYETINKGRDVLAWKQLKHVQNIKPTAHVRDTDVVHEYGWGDQEHGSKDTSTITFKGLTDEEATNEVLTNPEIDAESFAQMAKESQLFLKMKSKLEQGDDILKDVAQT
jgi:hypothetical protein